MKLMEQYILMPLNSLFKSSLIIIFSVDNQIILKKIKLLFFLKLFSNDYKYKKWTVLKGFAFGNKSWTCYVSTCACIFRGQILLFLYQHGRVSTDCLVCILCKAARIAILTNLNVQVILTYTILLLHAISKQECLLNSYLA